MRLFPLLFFLSILLFFNCFDHAERDNPLDPMSNFYHEHGRIEGIVTSYYPPYIGIKGVELMLIPGYAGTRTDSDGYFIIDGVNAGEYILKATKTGYASDSSLVVIRQGYNTLQNFTLDALPVFTNAKVTSAHVSRWLPPPNDSRFYFYFTVNVDDPDGSGDIDLVTVSCPDIGLVDTLSYVITSGSFEAHVDSDELEPTALLGHPVFFEARDLVGNKNFSTPVYLVRIIEDTPIPVSPVLQQSVTNTPQLIWEPSNVIFPFTYRIEVYNIDAGLPILVWSKGDIAATENSITVSDPLATGRYYWTVAIVDEFGNWSCSKEASFLVEVY